MSRFNDIFQWCVILLFLAVFLVYTSFFVYDIIHPTNDTITLNVVGINESTNTTTLVSVYVDCMKYCERYGSNTNELKVCYNACFKILEINNDT